MFNLPEEARAFLVELVGMTTDWRELYVVRVWAIELVDAGLMTHDQMDRIVWESPVTWA